MATLRDEIWDIISEYEEEHYNSVKALEEIMGAINKDPGILRPAMKWFSELMEEDLRKNDFKGGWLDGRLWYYWEKALGHIMILRPPSDSIKIKITSKKWAIGHCAKAANYLMMVAHNLMEELRKGEKPSD